MLKVSKKGKEKKVQHCQVHYQLLYVFQGRKALRGFFLRIFSSLTCLKKMFSASGIFCGGRYQPGCTGIFWPAQGTSQPVTISKKWKKSQLCFSQEKDLSRGPPTPIEWALCGLWIRINLWSSCTASPTAARATPSHPFTPSIFRPCK